MGDDHTNPVYCTSGSSGLYFLWIGAESGWAVVKADFEGIRCGEKFPFIKGGFGPHNTIASDGKYIYVTFGEDKEGTSH